MPSPTLPSDICGTVPSPSSSLCDRIKALLRLPQLLCDFFEWMLDDTGNITAEFSNFVLPTGIILPSSVSLGDGWLECNGSAVSRTTYATLYAAIGTTWGIGDGVNTFNVPDLRGRCMIGSGTGTGLTMRVLGTQDIGSEQVTLNANNAPAHYHGLGNVVDGSNDDDLAILERDWTDPDGSLWWQHWTHGNTGDANRAQVSSGLLASTNGITDTEAAATTAHDNMQPSAVVKFFIKT